MMINILVSLKLAILLNSVFLVEPVLIERLGTTDSIIMVNGKVLNAQTQMPVKANIVLERLPLYNNIIVSSSDSETGDYEVKIMNEVKYSIVVKAEGFTTYRDEFNFKLDSEEGLVKDIYLIPNVVGQILRMNKLLFQQSTAKISDSSFGELNNLIMLLNDNPAMVIQLEGHTDYRGNPKLNMKLSQERVEEVKKYITDKGIKKSRVKVKAFGGSSPLTNENSEDAQQMNRRVEVRILKN